MRASLHLRSSTAAVVVFLTGCVDGPGEDPTGALVVSGSGTLNHTTFGWDDAHQKIIVLEVGERLGIWANVSVDHDAAGGLRLAFGVRTEAEDGIDLLGNHSARPQQFGAPEIIRVAQVISLCHLGGGASNVTVRITDTSDGPRPGYSGSTAWTFERIAPCAGDRGGA